MAQWKKAERRCVDVGEERVPEGEVDRFGCQLWLGSTSERSWRRGRDSEHTTATETRGKTINAGSTLNFVSNDLSTLGDFLLELWGAVKLDLRAISSSGGDCRDRQCLTINSDGRPAPKQLY